MIVKGVPYGEARRLRYFVLISTELLRSDSVDIDLFIDRFLRTIESTNLELPHYVRDTGIIQSRAVARNYLRFANWLNFIRIENRIVIPNSYTVFLANLDGRPDFFLTNREKIAFFLRLIELRDFKSLICSLRIENSIKESVKMLSLSEHFVETYYEWLIDLAILKPTRRKFGQFCLTNLGYQTGEAIKRSDQTISKYAEQVLGVTLATILEISDDELWKAVKKSIDRLGSYARSEIDSGLYSAYPLILDLQMQLILEHHCLISKTEIVKRLNAVSTNYNAVFSWDSLADSSFLKLQRQ